MGYPIPNHGGGPLVWRDVQAIPGSTPVVVSYFTDLFYMREAFELVRSCQEHDLDFDVRQVPDLGTWEGNTSYKPNFLLLMSYTYPDRSILWLDADARVRRTPRLLYDLVVAPVAFHKLRGVEVLSGTVLLGRSRTRDALLTAWATECNSQPHRTDQECLGRVVKELGITVHDLPESYCQIFDFVGGYSTQRLEVDGEPVIEHMQASRWARRLSK